MDCKKFGKRNLHKQIIAILLNGYYLFCKSHENFNESNEIRIHNAW
jgi:hypothetical protein